MKEKCNMKGCQGGHADTKLRRVPSIAEPLPDGSSEKRQITNYVRRLTRAEITDRLGLSRKCSMPDVRYCCCHPTEKKTMHR